MSWDYEPSEDLNFVGHDGHQLAMEFDRRFRFVQSSDSEYGAWLDGVVSHELYERLSATPQTWPELMKGFPGPWLPGREASLGRAMKFLAEHGALVIERRRCKNMAGFEWEEIRYSINALQQLAML